MLPYLRLRIDTKLKQPELSVQIQQGVTVAPTLRLFAIIVPTTCYLARRVTRVGSIYFYLIARI